MSDTPSFSQSQDVFSQVRMLKTKDQKHKNDSDWKQMNIILAAVGEVLQAKNTPNTPVAYFAALLSTLEQEQKDQNIAAILGLIAMSCQQYVLQMATCCAIVCL